jgi:hypothetical protein
MKTCAVPNCTGKHSARGYCHTHYMRIMAHGDPNTVKLKRHGKDKNTYNRWLAMVKRCTDPADKHFKNYGGRGITVCERWMSFENFYADMGKSPDGLSLDRIDNDRGYEPDNVRWATRKMQQRNRRCVHLSIEVARDIRARWAAGEMQKDIAAHYGLIPAYVCQIVHHRIWAEDVGGIAT